MRHAWLLSLPLLACAHRRSPPPAYDHPLAADGAAARLRQAADRVDARDYAGAEALVRELLSDREAREGAAAARLRASLDAWAGGQLATARQFLSDVVATFPETQGAGHARRLLDELSVVGQPARSLDGVRWLQGEAGLDEGTTLLFFFEPWCPHCRRELPQVVARQAALEGLRVVGLTTLSRGGTEADAFAMLAEAGATFPVGVEDGTTAARFAVQGVPAAAVVVEGVVAWRGHPMLLGEDLLRALVDAP